jgi:hypothetical protein
VVGLATLGACGGGDDPPAATDEGDDLATDETTSTSAAAGLPGSDGGPPASVDQGPFCTSVQGIQNLGAGGSETGAPEEVLAQNEAMLDLLDEATATVPAGAPADVESLFDDYARIAEAIGEAAGDIDAAYAAIQEQEPELAARLFNPTAHLPAFEYFSNHCGISFQ